ncbi:hypothetical protein [Acetobacter oeni]|uniref:Uncharacterized protein n=1 Tax=Acetobacter oeni TaxID=304077 RepID=A0A511XMV9_9PROT|nr:hypothetical protein [Acetobacter oeni]MBB3882877.1 hypothetical protein [Acetobacter oeni]NHO18962.1 hypothetical protein [Acetobacter oeni]GBR01826.1 hypothetical protein AA21952_0546 [Acetobacter oeni LMG 21952]GEN64256.1 hypothetical protein AOE01nite_24800 [Acetobacter oeni]
MTTLSNISGTSYAVLAMQHKARTSGSPTTVADTNINATGKRSHGSSLSIGLDATGNVITEEDRSKADKDETSASVNLFG